MTTQWYAAGLGHQTCPQVWSWRPDLTGCTTGVRDREETGV